MNGTKLTASQTKAISDYAKCGYNVEINSWIGRSVFVKLIDRVLDETSGFASIGPNGKIDQTNL
jgi:hypothetical protein